MPMAVTVLFEMAGSLTLTRAVRLQGLTSSPTPGARVWGACACAAPDIVRGEVRAAKILKGARMLTI
jgi:hypothetical protein